MTDSRIPLFPLDAVLYPGATLPLHIFEPRYKLMIRHCLRDNCEFGVILAGEKGVATVGCTAAITRKMKDYPDGRMDILTQGRAVFRALNCSMKRNITRRWSNIWQINPNSPANRLAARKKVSSSDYFRSATR